MENNNEESEYMEVLDDDRCPTCKTEMAQGPHTCPYSEEINGDTFSLCHCCSFCTGQCAMDI
jgi:hypothetical protein